MRPGCPAVIADVDSAMLLILRHRMKCIDAGNRHRIDLNIPRHLSKWFSRSAQVLPPSVVL